MPDSAKPIARPNLRAMSDAELVELQMHANDWYVRQSRTLLQHRAAMGKLDKSLVHAKLQQQLTTAQRPQAPSGNVGA